MSFPKMIPVRIRVLLIAAWMASSVYGQNPMSVDQVVKGLESRSQSISNGRVEFLQSIFLPAKKIQVMHSKRDANGKIYEETESFQDQPEERIDTRHILTFVDGDHVRLDNFVIVSNDPTGEKYRQWSTTTDWGDERRITPNEVQHPIDIYPGMPNRLGQEAIGNGQAFIWGIKQAFVKEEGLTLDDLLQVQSVVIDGQSMILLSTRSGLKLKRPFIPTELVVDPSKSFLVRKMSYWAPNKENASKYVITTYDDPASTEDGFWYPSRVIEEKFSFSDEAKAVVLTKRTETHIVKFETNITDLDAKEIFDRSLPDGRNIVDHRVGVPGGFAF